MVRRPEESGIRQFGSINLGRVGNNAPYYASFIFAWKSSDRQMYGIRAVSFELPDIRSRIRFSIRAHQIVSPTVVHNICSKMSTTTNCRHWTTLPEYSLLRLDPAAVMP